MRRNLSLMLEFEGYRVCSAENGKVGVELALQERPDLIICDVMMPELDGYGVVQALRANPDFTNTPFIFLTAKGDKADVRVGMNFGADDYLTKPVLREDLLGAVQSRLNRAAPVQDRVQDAIEAAGAGFNPDFSSPEPLQRVLGLTPREAEVLLWVTQGKSNLDVAAILGMSDKTVKQHMGSVFQKLGVESRNAASLRALEILSGTKATGVSKP